MHTNSTLQATISPQWLSELRQLWPSVFPNELHVSLYPGKFPHYACTVA